MFLPSTAGQQGATKQLSQTFDKSCTEAKTCKYALMCIILLIKDVCTLRNQRCDNSRIKREIQRSFSVK